MCCILNKRCETGKQNHREQDLGLSPNGKATDSDSVIFQVRILVALLQTPKENSSGVFVYGIYPVEGIGVFRVPKNGDARNKKPPALRVETKRCTKKSPFRYNRVVQALL